MKKVAYILIANSLMTVFASCGSSEDPNLVALKEQRDSLKNVYKEVSTALSEVELQIANLDTNNTSSIKNVLYLEAKKQSFSHYFEVQGVVETSGNANLSTETPGTVSRVYVKTGDVVSAGQLLVSIDDELMQKNVAELNNSLSLAQDVFNRQKKLWDQKIGSEMEYLQAKNTVEGLELKIKTIKAQQGKSSIRAPFSGVIDEVMIKKGQLASPGFPVLRLVSMSGAYLKADVSESHLLAVRKGHKVQVKFPSLNINQSAVVSRVGSFIDPNNRTFLVEVDLSKTKAPLKPNLLGYVWINDYNNDSSIVVPSGIILQDATGANFVYKANTASEKQVKAEKVKVKIGMSYEGKTEVLSGLSEGEVIITEGARLLTSGEQVILRETPTEN